MELAEQVLELPVRLGVPNGVSGLVEAVGDPRQATGVGLVTYAFNRDRDENGNGHSEARRGFSGVRRWLSEFF